MRGISASTASPLRRWIGGDSGTPAPDDDLVGTDEHQERVSTFVLSWDEPARDRLRARCEAATVLDVVGFGRDLRSTLRFLRDHAVDVVVAELDAAWGTAAGVVSIIRSAQPEVRIVIWGDDISQFEDAFDAGVDAWVSRAATPTTIAAAATGNPVRPA